MKSRLSFAAFLAFCMVPLRAEAQTFFQGTENLQAPETSITFDGQPNGSAVLQTHASRGMTADASAWHNSNYIRFGFPHTSDVSATNFGSAGTVKTVNLFFDRELESLAYTMVTNSGQSQVEALLKGVVVGVGTYVSTGVMHGANIVGFVGGKFDQIRISPGGFNNALLIDNVQVKSLLAARAVFVSPSGSDTGTGSISSPWRTVARGLTGVQPGYTLYLREGVYRERIKSPSIRQGTASEPITVTAFPGEKPVIQGLLWLSRPSYWNIDGIRVIWDDATGLANEHMVKMTNGAGWTIKNCEFSGARSYANLYIYGSIAGEPSNWRVAYNAIHDTFPTNSTNQDHLIYCNSGLTGTGGVIERNLLWNAPNGDGVKLGGSSSTSGGAANVTVRFNTIYNTSMNVRACWTSTNNRIERNLLVRTKSQYGNVRGYQLSGTGNMAASNMGYLAKSIIDNYDGGLGVADGGGNQFPVDPQFDSISPTGFHPQDTRAAAFGRYGM